MQYLNLKAIVIAIFLFLALATANAEVTEDTQSKDTPTRCTAPIAKIALGNIRCKAAQCKKADLGNPSQMILTSLMALTGQPSMEGVGEGISDMYLSALKKTGCFEVLDRENLRELQQELEMMGKSLKDVQVADYMVSGAITSINIEMKNTNIGGGFIPVIGEIDVKTTKATITMDVRLIDIASTTILETRTYKAQSGKTSTAIGGAGFGDIGFFGSHSTLKGTPLEDVTREIVVKSTLDLISYIQSRKAQERPSDTKAIQSTRETKLTQSKKEEQ